MTLRHITSLKSEKHVVIIFNTCSIYTSFLINVHIISSDSAWLNKQNQTNIIMIKER